MKRFIVWSTVAAVLIVGITGGWFAYHSYTEVKEKRRIELFPVLNTINIPIGIIGEEYNNEIIASVIGDNVELRMEIESLPSGFTLSDCKNRYNVEVMEKPNTLLTCNLRGKSEVPLYENLLVTLIAEKYINRMQYEVQFTVLDELPN